MDATAVKAEIKSWEHQFRAQNGRSATIKDVKALPSIAMKYKLYKKLTKEMDHKKEKTVESQGQVPAAPRTPSPPARSRHMWSDASPAVILPKSRPIMFSSNIETKNPFSPVKKTKSNSSKATTSINPFLTPVKAKRIPSPNPSSPVQDSPTLVPQKNEAIVKARKRLRGESVSPSPQPREKRHRTNGLNPPAHDQLSQKRSTSPPVDNAEECSGFVDDSPVRVPAGAKAFKPLFEEVLPLSQPTYSKAGMARSVAFSRAKTLPSNLFGAAKKETKDGQYGEMTHKMALDPFGGHATLENARTSKLHENNAKRKGREVGSLDGIQKAKKPKALPGPDEEDDATSLDSVEVNVVSWHGGPRSPQAQETDLTLAVDPELQPFNLPSGTAWSSSPTLEKFEVDLPEEMRKILALSPREAEKEKEEEDLVKGLIRGRRRGGAEVWAPGEVGGETETSDEGITRVLEEDWEGEGISWEVAEL